MEVLPGPLDGRIDGRKLLQRLSCLGDGDLALLLHFEASLQRDGRRLSPAESLHLGEDPLHHLSVGNATVPRSRYIRPVRGVRPLVGWMHPVSRLDRVQGIVGNVRVGTLVSEATPAIGTSHGALKEPANEAVGVKAVVARQRLPSSVRPCVHIRLLADSARRVCLCHVKVLCTRPSVSETFDSSKKNGKVRRSLSQD